MSGQPLSETFLPVDIDLPATYPGLRYLGFAGRLHMAQDADGNWALLIDLRRHRTDRPPEQQVRALTFASPTDLVAFVQRAFLTTRDTFLGTTDGPTDGPGGARVPAPPTTPPPARPGGAALTMDEAIVSPRSV